MEASYTSKRVEKRVRSNTLGLLAFDFHSVQFSERAEFCNRFLLKCAQSATSNKIRSTLQHTFQKKAIAKFCALAELH